MLKKTITYTDFGGNEVTEDYYFHLSKAELVELEMSHRGGLSEWLKGIVASEDGAAIISEFKKLILMSYGKRSEDGKRFVKNDELREEFSSTEAYSTLFMELVTNAEEAAKFVNGIVPAGLEQDISKFKPNPEADPTAVEPTSRNVFETKKEPRPITRAEAIEMPAQELQQLLSSGQAVLVSEE